MRWFERYLTEGPATTCSWRVAAPSLDVRKADSQSRGAGFERGRADGHTLRR